jgi:ketosteroid isomerase-like protein
MKTVRILVLLALGAISAFAQESDVAQIKALTKEFSERIVAKDLTVIDKVFDADPRNVFYDINEQMIGLPRMKQVWQAATGNYTLSAFTFDEAAMNVTVTGDHAALTTTWRQTQAPRGGASRNVAGRVTILWKKSGSTWKAYHYHASVTPARS